MDNDKIGKFIAELRKEKNMTQKELAEKLHITDSAISKWERGVGCPDISLIESLGKVLGVTINEILAGERINNMTKEKSDNIIKEIVPFYQKKYFRKELVKVVLTVFVMIVVIYFTLLCVGEASYGSLSFYNDRLSADLPSFSKTVVKNNSKKFIKALKNYDYKTIKKMLKPSNVREWAEDREWLTMDEYIDNLKALEKEGVRIVNYKIYGCYNDGTLYYCNFYLVFKSSKTNYYINTSLENYREMVVVNGFGLTNKEHNIPGEYELEVKIKSDETLQKIQKIFTSY